MLRLLAGRADAAGLATTAGLRISELDRAASHGSDGGRMRRYSAREVGALIVILIGFVVLGSTVVLNPWVPRLIGSAAVIERLDVLGSYGLAAFVLGILVICFGVQLSKQETGRLDGPVMLVLVLTAFVLLDRLLLLGFGLPLWVSDVELHYRQRPDTVRTLRQMGRPRDLVVINSYGYHDTEFPEQKREGEFRGLLLGDSIAMGFGVTYAETFAKHLEDLLGERDRRFASHQIINTGVHGYSSFQELRVLQETLRFEPDFIAVGFCMNDVTEPFVVDERYGGVGVDYHGVSQGSSRISGYLMNETGYGRLIQKLRSRSKQLAAEKRRETFNVRYMSEQTGRNPDIDRAWGVVLADLEKMYAIAKAEGIPIVVLVFPFVFQVSDPALRAPQALLLEHAREHGVEAIDFTPIFEAEIFDDPELLALLARRGYTPDEVLEFHQAKLEQYFFDSDHFTEKGHHVVAEKMLEYLLQKDLVGR